MQRFFFFFVHHGKRGEWRWIPGRGGTGSWERDLQFQELVWIRCSVKDRVCWLFQPARRSSLKKKKVLLLGRGDERRCGQDKTKIQNLQWWPVGIFSPNQETEKKAREAVAAARGRRVSARAARCTRAPHLPAGRRRHWSRTRRAQESRCCPGMRYQSSRDNLGT